MTRGFPGSHSNGMKHIVLSLVLLAGPAYAACPAAPDIDMELDQLIEAAREAPDDMAAREISGQMWRLWLKAPDAIAQEMLDSGMRLLFQFG